MPENRWKDLYGPKSEEFIEGAIAAAEMYAYMIEGIYHVGHPFYPDPHPKPLKEAVAEIREGLK